MAGSLNRASLIGNVGKEPELRSTQDGREIASFTLATSESWKSKATGERESRTEWHRCVAFNESLVDVIRKYVKKGSKLMVEGQIRTRKWTDNDGADRYSTEIVVQGFDGRIVLLDSKGGDAGDTEGQRKPTERASDPRDDDDMIPF